LLYFSNSIAAFSPQSGSRYLLNLPIKVVCFDVEQSGLPLQESYW
jgi:hypothetical protein